MTPTQFVPSETDRTDVTIGLVVEDQRTGDHRQVVYADDRVVLVRDEAGHSTLTPRGAFADELGSRYRPRPGTAVDVEGGPFDRLRAHLAAYEEREGRKADHKADALREAVGLVDGTGESDDGAGSGDDDGDGDEAPAAPEASFEGVDGVGPETAANLRTAGFVTEADVRRASDDALLAVAGVGPANLAAIRESV